MENYCMFISSDGLLRIPGPKEQAQVRLVCFPPGGADAFIWDAYSHFLPESIEICAIQLPNRGPELARYTERAQIIAEVAQSLLTHAREGQQLVFHGYCVGALWGYEVALYLREHAGVQPDHFIVAGCMAPHQRYTQTEFMKTTDFVDVMTSFYKPNSPEHNYVLSTVPAVKHDAAMLEQEMPPLEKRFDFPLTIFGTEHDQFVSNAEDLWAWQAYTTGPFRVQMFEGDHFFGLHHPDILMKAITACIQGETPPA
jgi:medium-chain acyl-[acyl-carrier-protein] hydrolase